uniref:DNA-directed RNA polymerase RBP11-like dimerisation domain-containing protein n=1 Tax=viral metagenome TaxID=1070528 RepID=A0A6C0JPF9_9ZZZZ
MNKPVPNHSFILFEGEKKISYIEDKNETNCFVYTIVKENHTLANLLNEELSKDPRVKFSGIKFPHPSESKFILVLKTYNDDNVKVFNDVVTKLFSLFSELETLFALA